MTTVLIASADSELRTAAAREISEGGHGTVLSPDPFEAMRLVKAGQVGAAIVDLELPEPGGLALIERIRADGAGRRLAILAVLPGGVVPESLPDEDTLERPLTRPNVNRAVGRLLAGTGSQRGGSPETGDAASGQEASWPRKVRRLCHDLNNPLAVIAGQVEIIAERHKDAPEDLKHRLDEIRNAAKRMIRLIKEAGAEARKAGPDGEEAGS